MNDSMRVASFYFEIIYFWILRIYEWSFSDIVYFSCLLLNEPSYDTLAYCNGIFSTSYAYINIRSNYIKIFGQNIK